MVFGAFADWDVPKGVRSFVDAETKDLQEKLRFSEEKYEELERQYGILFRQYLALKEKHE